MLNAESYTTAISGIGVMDWPIQQYLDNTITFDSTSANAWDWSSPSGLPDAVVVLIGPNDDSSKTSKFKKAYLNLVTMLKDESRYGTEMPIIHVCGGSGNGLDPCDAIEEVVGSENIVSIKQKDWNMINSKNSGYLGCDSHYNKAGHQVLMEDIVEKVERLLNW